MRIQWSPELFFAVNGLIVAVVIFQFLRYLRSRQDSQFRDNLWVADEKTQKTVDLLALEAPAASNPAGPPPPEREAPPFKTPNFRGKPHEILGISAGAPTAEILAAYKYWIKRYHPDRMAHLGPGYIRQANRRSEQLNEAKASLLKEKH